MKLVTTVAFAVLAAHLLIPAAAHAAPITISDYHGSLVAVAEADETGMPTQTFDFSGSGADADTHSVTASSFNTVTASIEYQLNENPGDLFIHASLSDPDGFGWNGTALADLTVNFTLDRPGLFIFDLSREPWDAGATSFQASLNGEAYDPAGLLLPGDHSLTFSLFAQGARTFHGTIDASAHLRVVPEPATATLLSLAAFTLLRRRRSFATA